MGVKSPHLPNRSKLCEYRSYFILERGITLYLSFQKSIRFLWIRRINQLKPLLLFLENAPSSSSSFIKSCEQGQKLGSVGLDGGSHYPGQLSLAPEETLLKVSWDGFGGATPDRTVEPELWVIPWQRADLGKGKSRRDAGVKGRWVMGKEQINRYGGPALGNIEMGEKGVWGKLAHIFRQDHLTHTKKQRLFLLPAISQVPSTHTYKNPSQRSFETGNFPRESDYQLLQFD